ncbi:hypothetical protein ACKWTF_012136 [Chironomus riparius]
MLPILTTSSLKCLWRKEHNDLQSHRMCAMVSSVLQNPQNLNLLKLSLTRKLLTLMCSVKAPIKMLRSLLVSFKASFKLFLLAGPNRFLAVIRKCFLLSHSRISHFTMSKP